MKKHYQHMQEVLRRKQETVTEFREQTMMKLQQREFSAKASKKRMEEEMRREAKKQHMLRWTVLVIIASKAQKIKEDVTKERIATQLASRRDRAARKIQAAWLAYLSAKGGQAALSRQGPSRMDVLVK